MARVRRYAPQAAGVPPEVGDQLHPLWRDAAALVSHPVFGVYVDRAVLERIGAGGRAYGTVVSRWAVASGFESDRYPRTVDWHALRAAGGE